MKELQFKTGGRRIRIEDFEALQENILANTAILPGDKNFVLKGCVITHYADPRTDMYGKRTAYCLDLPDGYVWLNGKVRKITNAKQIEWAPYAEWYIIEDNDLSNSPIEYFDGTNKEQFHVYAAKYELFTGDPVGKSFIRLKDRISLSDYKSEYHFEDYENDYLNELSYPRNGGSMKEGSKTTWYNQSEQTNEEGHRVTIDPVAGISVNEKNGLLTERVDISSGHGVVAEWRQIKNNGSQAWKKTDVDSSGIAMSDSENGQFFGCNVARLFHATLSANKLTDLDLNEEADVPSIIGFFNRLREDNTIRAKVLQYGDGEESVNINISDIFTINGGVLKDNATLKIGSDETNTYITNQRIFSQNIKANNNLEGTNLLDENGNGAAIKDIIGIVNQFAEVIETADIKASDSVTTKSLISTYLYADNGTEYVNTFKIVDFFKSLDNSSFSLNDTYIQIGKGSNCSVLTDESVKTSKLECNHIITGYTDGVPSTISPSNIVVRSELGAYYSKEETDEKFLSKGDASSKYLSKVDAGNIYLPKDGAVAMYLKKDDASATYLKKDDAESNFMDINTNVSKCLTKTEAQGVYLTKESATEKYLTKTDAGMIYAAKDMVNGECAKIRSELSNYLQTSVAESQYVKQIDLNNTLSNYHNSSYIDTNFATKSALNSYLLKSELNDSLQKYLTDNRYVTSSIIYAGVNTQMLSATQISTSTIFSGNIQVGAAGNAIFINSSNDGGITTQGNIECTELNAEFVEAQQGFIVNGATGVGYRTIALKDSSGNTVTLTINGGIITSIV